MAGGVWRPVALVLAVLGLASLASASGDAALWVVSTASPSEPADSPVPAEPTTFEPASPVRDDPGSWSGSIVDVVVLIVIVALVVGGFGVLWQRRTGRAGRWSAVVREPRRQRPPAELPAVAADEQPLHIDAEAARAALSGGTPRNAVVACWMQLETDAASVGVARGPAETSSEYAVRVIRARSLDPEPVESLAARYREARFSRHPLGDADRAAAVDDLEHVLAALPHRARQLDSPGRPA